MSLEINKDVTEQQPERFRRAVRAGCETDNDDGSVCTYPDCVGGGCGWYTKVLRAAILAWEKPQHLEAPPTIIHPGYKW